MPSRFPSVLTIETVANCNLRCPYCAVHTVKHGRQRPYMEVELFRRLAEECGRHDPFVWLNFMGEALLHPQLRDILDAASCHGLRCGLETNGTLLRESTVEWLAAGPLARLLVTVEPTPELFAEHRQPGDLNTVLAGLRRFLARRNQCNGRTRVELQMIVAPHNCELTADFTAMASALGVDAAFTKPMMIHQYEGNGAYAAEIGRRYWSEEIAGRYVRWSDGSLGLPPDALATPCPKTDEAVILADGRMVACCYDKAAQYVLGDASVDGVETLWRASAGFRAEAMSRRELSLCGHCLSGQIEEIMTDVLAPAAASGLPCIRP